MRVEPTGGGPPPPVQGRYRAPGAVRALRLNVIVLCVAAAALVAGAVLVWTGRGDLGHVLWAVGALPTLALVLHGMVRAFLRREAGVDVLAAIAIIAAIVLGEDLSACIVAVMFASGQVLEGFATARAGRELSALLAAAPRHAYRFDGETLIQIELDAVRVGDRLLVKGGETVPVDGVIGSVSATLDEAVLSGESAPVERRQGDAVRSGAINAGAPFEMQAVETAARSTFAGIARLVDAARNVRAPGTRLADRYAFWFVPLSLGTALLAWAVSGDPVRALAVLVVATPCPLILAVPVALVSGMSSCARRGIVVKGGAALEALAHATVLFFDKTGTLTGGHARLAHLETSAGVDQAELLRAAASLDQVSGHVTAAAIVAAARARNIPLSLPRDVVEEHGAGLSGVVDGMQVKVGTPDYVCRDLQEPPWHAGFMAAVGGEGGSRVYVARDGQVIGALHLADQIRLETPRALRMLRRAGISRIVMLTGDRDDVATTIGTVIGIDDIRAELDPAGKLAALREVPRGVTSIMVGDGVNDAPALAAAGVGVAMGARGAAASSEAADVVLLVDRLDRLAEAVYLARATRRIALQSVALGMGLSLCAMAAAFSGLLLPAYGAALQEVIDVIAISNALRVLWVAPLRASRRALPAEQARQLQDEHAQLVPVLDQLTYLADQISVMSAPDALNALRAFDRAHLGTLVSHEQADEAGVYPAIAGLLGGDDPMASLSRTHREIFVLARNLHRMVDALPSASTDAVTDAATIRAIQRILVSLDAIVRLHFAQEDELYLTLR